MVENGFGILMSRFRILLGTMEQRPRVGRHCAHVCGVAQLLLALIDVEYRFLCIDCMCSEAQIFNNSNLREKIKDGPLGLWHLNCLGREGQICTTSCLCVDAISLIPWMVKPWSRRQLTREERVANYRISRQESG